tara:strand:- start:194 stop:688 length:495 start_codon:yes stop_codon:yes gene_type:complete
MKKVSFTEMKKGTKEDYLFLDKHEKNFASKTADRILKFMSGLTETLEGYQVSRLEHSLQSATRAYKNNESEEMVVAALLHDIGDELAPMNHSEYAAAILKPYVSEKTTKTKEKDRDTLNIEDEISGNFGHKTEIETKTTKTGKVSIFYHSPDELETIIQKLLKL